MMLTHSIVMDLKTRQVNFSNAFTQAELHGDEQVFVKLPYDFEALLDRYFVLKLNKSLYGLNVAPLCWFKKLSTGLKLCQFWQSKIDPCVFLHPKIVCICYVDDCLLFAKENSDISVMIANLCEDLMLEVEDKVIQFLGIEHTHTPEGKLELVQTNLIEKPLAFCRLSDWNTKATLANQIPLGFNL